MIRLWKPESQQEPGVNNPVLIWVKRAGQSEFEDKPVVAEYCQRQGNDRAYFKLSQPLTVPQSQGDTVPVLRDDYVATEDDTVCFMEVESTKIALRSGYLDAVNKALGVQDKSNKIVLHRCDTNGEVCYTVGTENGSFMSAQTLREVEYYLLGIFDVVKGDYNVRELNSIKRALLPD